MQRRWNTHLPAMLPVCAAWLLFVASGVFAVPPKASRPDVSVPGRIGIPAGDLRITLQNVKGGMRVAGLLDTGTGQELSAAVPLPLFSMVLRDAQSKEQLTLTADSGWKHAQAAYSETRNRHTLTFRNPTDDRFAGIGVELTLDVHASAGALIWNLKITNENPQWALWRVVFPQVAMRDLGETARVFAQVTSGVELSGLWARADKRGGAYPGGWTAMQYMAAYNAIRGTGLYVGMHDPSGCTKDLFAQGLPDKQAVALTFDHPVPNMGKPGVGFELPGVARWQLLRGDWFDAAMIYREWVVKEAKWWPALGPNGREDTPQWMRELPAWVMAGGPASDCVPKVKAFAQAIGLPSGFHWYNWHQIPFDNDYPHYFPVKDGFNEGVMKLKAAGVYPMPYINGRLWDTRDKDAEDWEFTKTAMPAATRDEDGKPCTESYGSKETDGKEVTLAVMCPTTALWQNRVRNIVLRLFNEYGVSGVYIDQIAAAAPRLCFDASHGHELGGGSWWTEGYWKMLDAIRAAKPADRMLTTECNAEPYIKWLDGYLTWHWQNQDMVPAFSAVYGGSIQMFGRAYRGGSTQDLANRMKAGQQLVYGEQIGWFGPEIMERADSAPFLRDCIRLRHLLSEYFYRGRMARPPRFAEPVPTVTADWQWSGEWLVTTSAVLTGAWQIPQDNKTILLCANVSDSPLASRLSVNPKDYGLAGRSITATTIHPDGTRTPLEIKAIDQARIEVPARSILAWEVLPAGEE